MNLDSFISIVSNLNNGSVIFDIADKDSEIMIGENNVKLYSGNQKYYFISEYNDNYNDIERSIKENKILKSIVDVRPNNSYLVLLYKIDAFDDEISKKIIRIEENEFFYKKYVFYYTEQELQSFNEWFEKRKDKTLSNILQTEDCSPESKNLHIQFLLRLVIKLPFLKLDFKKIELDDFDLLLTSQFNGIRNNKDVITGLYTRFCKELETATAEEIAQTLFDEIIGGNNDENQVN